MKYSPMRSVHYSPTRPNSLTRISQGLQTYRLKSGVPIYCFIHYFLGEITNSEDATDVDVQSAPSPCLRPSHIPISQSCVIRSIQPRFQPTLPFQSILAKRILVQPAVPNAFLAGPDRDNCRCQ